MNLCNKCGEVLDQRERFCTFCGEPVVTGQAAAQTPSATTFAAAPPPNATAQATASRNKICNECGQELPPNATVCTLCRAPIN